MVTLGVARETWWAPPVSGPGGSAVGPWSVVLHAYAPWPLAQGSGLGLFDLLASSLFRERTHSALSSPSPPLMGRSRSCGPS